MIPVRSTDIVRSGAGHRRPDSARGGRAPLDGCLLPPD